MNTIERYQKGDTVEVVTHCAWTGDVGQVTRTLGLSTVYVKLEGYDKALPFHPTDIKHSQQRLF